MCLRSNRRCSAKWLWCVAADTVAAHEAIAIGVATGDLTPGEASALSTVVGGIAKSLELVAIEDRLAAIEAHIERGES